MEGKAQEISNTVWASARLGVKMPRMVEALGRRETVEKIVEGHPQAIANVTWGMATVGCGGEEAEELARAFEDEDVVERFVRQGSPQAIANTLWGFTTMNVDVPVLRRVVCRDDVAAKIFNHRSPNATQNMSNIVWCLAKAANLNVGRGDFSSSSGGSSSSNGEDSNSNSWMDGVLNKFSQGGVIDMLVKHGKPQEISSVVWALTSMDQTLSSELVRGINSKEVVSRIKRDGSSQCVGNIMWSLSKGGHACRLGDEVDDAQSADKFITGTSPQNVAIALWSLATMKKFGHAFVERVGEKEAVEEFLQDCLPRDVSNLVWALGVLRSSSSLLLLESIAAEVERFTVSPDSNPQVLSNIVHGYAKLGAFDGRVFRAVADQADRILKEGTLQDITNTVWAFAVAGKVEENERRVRELWEEAWRRAEGAEDSFLIQLENARLLARDCEGIELVVEDEGLKAEVTRAVERQYEGERARSARGGQFEEMIVKDLMDFGFGEGLEREVSPWVGVGDDGGEGKLLPIDIAWNLGQGKRVALELDGPSHFLIGGGKTTRDGPTKAKSLLLSNLGWAVERFAWFNNKKLEKMSREERKSFWTAKLARSGIENGME
ncbi:hypothetical protein TrST_g14348 [Triparma strigata]|uniref:RAP domain-containing protein n=1 Tax=Triparma strigata TaxID=1606541 RepID=A0A9W7B6F4_9STRA|nr:hypothetical protein TrST_g14348 [Triparma strigata]